MRRLWRPVSATPPHGQAFFSEDEAGCRPTDSCLQALLAWVRSTAAAEGVSAGYSSFYGCLRAPSPPRNRRGTELAL
ncbi:hypothetical protein NDU88_000516 [Pleurodeles waltl]|uniref:Uncharacterized protein n=1 Tax=Pleurodeles waltl TaxID=8319 RepID=A0AAV7P139_PLEWA|nr:hypothetical protein NDU88_000516 [Pleurodeles waltl]